EPETLGKLDLYVLADKKNLQLVFAAGEDTRKILQAAQGELKDILESFGCSLADLGFSSYAGAKHQELEAQFLAQETGQREYDILKIIQKKDIITEVRHLLRDMLVNYLA
ncbi:MAG: flagellar hook-length control protein FliK, partial [Candidatus Margulisbacteria bacterium]|nr:flagellar hook-length control protein FliK [Candidatus Margulisiibacteriota bacterium]